MAVAGIHLNGVSSQGSDGAADGLAAAGQLAAGVAHDVNNIVTVIKLYAELLESEADLNDQARERLHAIRLQAERAVSLGWQVLDSAHRQPLQLEDLDLVAFLDDFGHVIERLLPPGVTLTVRSERPRHVVQADATRVQQVITNLVGNAAQALAGGGHVTVAVSSDHWGGTGEWARIDVADTGAGIPPEVLARVFEPFFSTKPAGKGSGLGLPQVQALVDQHGGHVSISSTVGQGTVVSVWLPAAGAIRHPERVSGRPRALPRGGGRVVLVVGSDHALRAALVDALTSLGYRPDAVGDGDDALAWLARPGARADAVVSDLAMAGLGGEGLARRMAVTYPQVPVVLMTAAPWVTAPREGGAGGLVFRLAKPFSAGQLARVLGAALG